MKRLSFLNLPGVFMRTAFTIAFFFLTMLSLIASCPLRAQSEDQIFERLTDPFFYKYPHRGFDSSRTHSTTGADDTRPWRGDVFGELHTGASRSG